MSHHSDDALLMAGTDSFWEPGDFSIALPVCFKQFSPESILNPRLLVSKIIIAGNYKKTTKRTEDGFRLCNDLILLIQERAEIEKIYAKSLKTWSKKWNELIERGPEYGTTEAGWKGVLIESEKVGDMHYQVKDQLLGEVRHTQFSVAICSHGYTMPNITGFHGAYTWLILICFFLLSTNSVYTAGGEQDQNLAEGQLPQVDDQPEGEEGVRRRVQEGIYLFLSSFDCWLMSPDNFTEILIDFFHFPGNQAQKPWAKILAKVEKAKVDYHTACKGERSASTQEKNASGDSSLSPDQVKKLQDKLTRCRDDVQKSKERYLQALAEINEYNAKYMEDMTVVFEKCQEFEERRLSFFKEMLFEIHGCLNISQNPELPKIYEEYRHTIQNSDAFKDLKWWSNNHGVGMAMNWPVFEVGQL